MKAPSHVLPLLANADACLQPSLFCGSKTRPHACCLCHHHVSRHSIACDRSNVVALAPLNSNGFGGRRRPAVRCISRSTRRVKGSKPKRAYKVLAFRVHARSHLSHTSPSFLVEASMCRRNLLFVQASFRCRRPFFLLPPGPLGGRSAYLYV